MLVKPDTCKGCPLYEPPTGKHTGFSRPDGTGKNGVLMVAEALGEQEEKEGIALVGKAGYYLFSELKRLGIERDDFTLFNTCACRPPDNKLAGMWYESKAIEHCSPNLDAVVKQARITAKENGKTFTILTLGRIAFKHVMGLNDKSPVMKADYLSYPFWCEKFQAYVIGTYHPSYIMRGNHHLVSVLGFGVNRALEIASDGFKFHTPSYLRDPEPHVFKEWVKGFKWAYENDPDNTYLVFDIETPFKQGTDEEAVAKEDDSDYTILRISFAYKAGDAVSVRWSAEYMAGIEELFSSPGPKIAHNAGYDVPRIRAN